MDTGKCAEYIHISKADKQNPSNFVLFDAASTPLNIIAAAFFRIPDGNSVLSFIFNVLLLKFIKIYIIF